ncbi:MAG: hypothetical protein ABIK68_08090 [bacterium]
MKSVIVDTSSAILLFKSELIVQLVKSYRTLITVSVYDELTQQGYAGSDKFRQLCNRKQIQILTSQKDTVPEKQKYPELPALNRGERDTITQQMLGAADFIIIDDGRALKYCKKVGLPFINALLFPRILFQNRSISEAEYHHKMAEIIQYGRYSKKIIHIASTFSDQAIQPFLPSNN